MQQGIKKLQGFEYLKVVFLEILNAELCRVFANQVTYAYNIETLRDTSLLVSHIINTQLSYHLIDIHSST